MKNLCKINILYSENIFANIIYISNDRSRQSFILQDIESPQVFAKVLLVRLVV